ncbi:phenylacetate-CoA ligase [Natranaerovirga hydrolytica]|uniref:Phenylacetate-CoA ligase n=1 Tax=Natranaerovirga hydrolytica TaxID=680378 RepID=A0A4R1MIV7_9FIRM|nr:phenylacetate--CoA ligase family protein [Natranaerovirga hydrolytica]TCK92606.1 phenylacetate-CoA ligase [Natranaerovirga hydrolytica]
MMLEEQKLGKLKQLLIYLMDHNAFYKSIQNNLQFDIHNDDIQEIYNKLPIVTKQDIINNPDIFFSETIKGEEIFEERTSGSTGNVLKCYKTNTERTLLALNIWKQRRKFDPMVNISNYYNLFNNEMEEIIGKFYNVDDKMVIRNFYRLMAVQPRWIAGPISLLSKFAILINEEKINYKNDGTLKFIEFHGENVDEKSRKFIEETFQCKTINNYGTSETWCIALDCDNQKLHIQDYIIADSKKDGEEDKLLITSLINKYMPIVKYANGDCGKPIEKDCDCHNNNSVIWLKGGRETDYITGTSVLGNYLFDEILWQAFERFGSVVHEYQVFQQELKKFEFIIAKGNHYSEDVTQFLHSRILQELGADNQVNFSFVDHVKALSNGKLKKFHPYKN